MMFFNNKKNQAKAAEQLIASAQPTTLEWKNSNRRSQSFQILATFWSSSFHPNLQSDEAGKFEITFGGIAYLGTTPNVPVHGEIEMCDAPETPRFLMDRWKCPPESIEGYALLSTEIDSALQRELYITLYCRTIAFDLIFRTLTAGFSNPASRLILNVDVGFPDEHGDNFWGEHWQGETLQVLKWAINSSSQR